MANSIDPGLLSEVASGLHDQPHDILGAHVEADGVVVRVLRPHASSVSIMTLDGTFPAKRDASGIWMACVPGDDAPDYRVVVTYPSEGDDSTPVTEDDPYRFLPSLGDLDRHLIMEGRHERLWEVLGANVKHYPSVLGEVDGTAFAVWAPNARIVRVVGDFNHWQGVGHTMRALGSTGLWELFIPGVVAGERYKFDVLGRDGHWQLKADPMAKATEAPSQTASVVAESTHTWEDDAWMEARESRHPESEAMSVYEVHLGSWKQGLSYRDLADELIPYVAETGFTHVEFMPVTEHPFPPSWGYQVTSYYAPTARFGGPDDFRYLVDRLHQAGIGVLLDWVPGHFPKDEWALARFDGTPLYEHPDPLRGEQPDWGTLVFDFARPEVRNFLVASAVFWLKEYHADGLRVDAVASMLYLDYSRKAGQWRPNIHGGRENLDAVAFLEEATSTTARLCPGTIMVAEESTAWPGVTTPRSAGGLGFSFKWNMGWMNDTLKYLAEQPEHRSHHHALVTFSMMYAFSEHFLLPLSHDEVVHGKGSLWTRMPGDEWQKAAGVRALLTYQWTHPGKKLLFMGGEFAQIREWAEDRSLDWDILDKPFHGGVHLLVRDLNALYHSTPALWELDSDPAGFEWIDSEDAAHCVLAYLRKDRDGHPLAVACNFSTDAHEDYRLGFPSAGPWDEILNSDSEFYGGSGVGNLGRVIADEIPQGRWANSASVRVPPLGAVIFRPADEESP